MFNIIIFFKKFYALILKQIVESIFNIHIMSLGKFINTCHGKTYFLFLLTHRNLHSTAFLLAAQIVKKVSTSVMLCSILKARSYTTKHGRRSRKSLLVSDSIEIRVSSAFQAQISGSKERTLRFEAGRGSNGFTILNMLCHQIN